MPWCTPTITTLSRRASGTKTARAVEHAAVTGEPGLRQPLDQVLALADEMGEGDGVGAFPVSEPGAVIRRQFLEYLDNLAPLAVVMGIEWLVHGPYDSRC